jgi:hypothetical protein
MWLRSLRAKKSAPAAPAPIPSYGPPLFKADAANLAFAADMEGGNGAASLGEARDRLRGQTGHCA